MATTWKTVQAQNNRDALSAINQGQRNIQSAISGLSDAAQGIGDTVQGQRDRITTANNNALQAELLAIQDLDAYAESSDQFTNRDALDARFGAGNYDFNAIQRDFYNRERSLRNEAIEDYQYSETVREQEDSPVAASWLNDIAAVQSVDELEQLRGSLGSRGLSEQGLVQVAQALNQREAAIWRERDQAITRGNAAKDRRDRRVRSQYMERVQASGTPEEKAAADAWLRTQGVLDTGSVLAEGNQAFRANGKHNAQQALNTQLMQMTQQNLEDEQTISQSSQDFVSQNPSEFRLDPESGDLGIVEAPTTEAGIMQSPEYLQLVRNSGGNLTGHQAVEYIKETINRNRGVNQRRTNTLNGFKGSLPKLRSNKEYEKLLLETARNNPFLTVADLNNAQNTIGGMINRYDTLTEKQQQVLASEMSPIENTAAVASELASSDYQQWEAANPVLPIAEPNAALADKKAADIVDDWMTTNNLQGEESATNWWYGTEAGSDLRSELMEDVASGYSGGASAVPEGASYPVNVVNAAIGRLNFEKGSYGEYKEFEKYLNHYMEVYTSATKTAEERIKRRNALDNTLKGIQSNLDKERRTRTRRILGNSVDLESYRD